MEPFSITLHARWADMDQNAHLANSSFLDMAVDARMSFFSQSGFAAAEFAKRRIGPVVRRDEMDYLREVHLLEALRVTLELAGMAENGSRFRLANDFYKADGTLCGRLRSEIGWLDLQARRLIVPPDDVQAALARLTRTADFAVLPPSVK
jgi:acyl-CoA thioester hydrolase